MNLAIRGLDFNLGKSNGDTFSQDQHPDLKADYILMNPPFGQSTEWGKDALSGDPRWAYGIPPAKPANYAWLQHAISKLSAKGQAGIVMPNGTLTTTQGGEDAIRKAIIEADLVECIIALPNQLFLNTTIPCCLWFLSKDKTKNGRDRRGETLFIDARKLGYMATRVNRDFTEEDVQRIAQTVHLWREDEDRLPVPDGQTAPTYADIPGFCKAAKLAEITEKGFVLSPGRYCGSEEVEDDEEAFDARINGLVSDMTTLLKRADDLKAQIQAGLKGIGYDL
jgi:type I restriction enzyme M protein